MKRCLYLIAILVVAAIAGSPLAWAQAAGEMKIDDQPGYEPDANVKLPAAFQRQMVFFRTSEPVGTIIVHGCIRLVNEDVIYLYDRTPLESRVVVLN